MWEIKFKFHAKTQMIDSSVDSNILLWYQYSVNMRRIFISAKSMFCEEPLDDFKDYILSISGLTSLMYLLGMSCIAHTRIQRPQPSLVAEASPKWSHSPGLTSLNRKTPLSRGFMLGGGEWGPPVEPLVQLLMLFEGQYTTITINDITMKGKK